MDARCSVAAVAWAALAVSQISAGEPLRVERTPPRKEPAYHSVAPRYCLLVVGPEAKKRHWIVLDGTTLHFDRDGDGDLTGPGEALRPERYLLIADGERQCCRAKLGALAGTDGRLVLSDLSFHFEVPQGQKPITFDIFASDRRLIPESLKKYGAGVGGIKVASGAFSRKPREAPVIWFDGPLQMILLFPENQFFVRGQERNVTVNVGTFLSKDGDRTLTLEEIPRNVHPVVEVTFPVAAGTKPVVAKFTLDQRC